METKKKKKKGYPKKRDEIEQIKGEKGRKKKGEKEMGGKKRQTKK